MFKILFSDTWVIHSDTIAHRVNF